jgi:tetratricopeptide (TPR) repeat protein
MLVLLAICGSAGEVRAQAADQPAPQRDANTDAGVELAVKESMRVGVDAYRRKDFESALKAYEKAWTLKQHTAIASALAEVEMKLGRYLAAAEHWNFYLANVPVEQDKSRTHAEEQLAECLRHLGRIRLELNVSGAILAIGPRQLTAAPTSQEVLVEPGTHEIRVERTGYEQEVKQLSVAPGETAEVRIELKPLRNTAAPAPVPTREYQPIQAGESTQTTSVSARTIVLVGGAALTITALTLGTVFQLQVYSLDDEVEEARQRTQATGDPEWVAFSGQCNAGAPNRPHADCKALTDKADERDRAASRASAGFITAGALGAATVATFFLWPSRPHSDHPDKTASWSVAPFPEVGLRGLQLRGRF